MTTITAVTVFSHITLLTEAYFSLNKLSPLLFQLSIQTLATSPNWYAAGISGSAANSSYLVKGISAPLSFSQECGMAELLTKSDRTDIQSLSSRAMLLFSVAFIYVFFAT